jgi:hypothetical protein
MVAIPAQERPASAGVEVILFATVMDFGARLVIGLPLRNFRVWDNGKEQKHFQFRSGPEPMSVGLLLDRSVSMTAGGKATRLTGADLQAAVKGFLKFGQPEQS